MAVVRHFSETDPVEYLVQWKFPLLAVFSHSVVQGHTTELSQQLLKEAEAYREELRAMSPADRQGLLTEAQRDQG